MLYGIKPFVTGMPSHPGGFPPSVGFVRLRRNRRIFHRPADMFTATPQISYTAGGANGDEFRPD